MVQNLKIHLQHREVEVEQLGNHFVSRKDAFALVQLVVGTMADCLLQPSGTEGLDNSQPTANSAEISPEK